MKIDPPPMNGNSKLAWIVGVVLTVLSFVIITGGAMIVQHGEDLAAKRVRIEQLEKAFAKIDEKLDRLLERLR